MKKLILSLLAAGFAATSFAHGQPEGGLLLYGVGTYSSMHGTSTSKFGTGNSNTVDRPRYINYEVSPGLGFNINECLTVGVDAFYRGSKTNWDKKTITIPGFDQVKTFDYGVGPFVRMTCPISDHFFAFGQFTAHYLKGRETFRTATAVSGGTSYVSDNNYKGFNGGFVPAVGAKLTKSVGMTFSVGGIQYEYRKYDYSPTLMMASPTPGSNFEAKTNDFSVTFGRQVNIGIQKYFGCGHKRRGNMEPMDETRHIDTSDDENGNHRKHKHDDE